MRLCAERGKGNDTVLVLRGRHGHRIYDRRHCISACVVCRYCGGRVREAARGNKKVKGNNLKGDTEHD